MHNLGLLSYKWLMYYICNLFISTFAAKCLLGQNAEQRRPADLDQSSMLKVICNQRDRFRARLRETEEVYIPLDLFYLYRGWNMNLLLFQFSCLVFKMLT